MVGFVLTLAEARVMYRRYHSLLEKGRKRLPGGEFWKELGTALRRSGASPKAERRRFFLALSLYFLGRRITDRLFPVRPSDQNLISPSENLTLYHWFPAECRESERREGLRPKAANGLVFLTDRPDFPHISPYFCQKVLEAGRDILPCADGHRKAFPISENLQHRPLL